MVNGRVMLFGIQHEGIQFVHQTENIELRERMKAFEPGLILWEVFMLWQDKALRQINDKEQNIQNRMNAKIEEITADFSELALVSESGDAGQMTTHINTIWQKISSAESITKIIGTKKLNDLKAICNGSLSHE